MGSPRLSVSKGTPFMDHLSLDIATADHTFSQSSLSQGHSAATSPLLLDQHSPFLGPPGLTVDRRPASVKNFSVAAHGASGASPSSRSDIAFRVRHSLPTSPALQDCNGLAQTAAPWNHFALAPPPVIKQDPQFLCPEQLTSTAVTDSGYESLQSASHQHQNASTRVVSGDQTSFESETLQQRKTHNQNMSQRGSVTQRLPSSASSSAADADTPEEFVCTECEEKLRFTTQSEYQKHMARHERKFKCNWHNCTRKEGFATQNDLDRHVKSVHKQVNVNDSVWKCFFPNCKSAEKIWSRQDNFRQHIVRMHKISTSEVEGYVRLSDEWLEGTEKPRRRQQQQLERQQQQQQQQYTTSYTSEGLRDTLAPACEPDPSVADTYDHSQIDVSEMFRSNLGHPYSIHDQMSLTPYGTGQNLLTGITGDYTEQDQYPTTVGIERSHSDNPALHFPNNEPGYDEMMPPIMSHREDPLDLPLSMNINYHGSSERVPPQSMPDLTRRDDWPDLTTTNPGMISPQDQIMTSYGGDFSHMGGPDLAINVQDEDMQTQSVIPSLDVVTETSGVRTIGGETKNFGRIVDDFLKNVNDNSLADKLQNAIRQVIQAHALSAPQVAGSYISGPGESTPFTCNRGDCGKTYTKKNTLVKHQKRHDQIFFCTYDGCFKRFGAKTDMQRHERLHPHPQAWRCWSDTRARFKNKECAKVFYNEVDFENHRKTEHSKGRSNDTFRIDKDFVGSFWCGFCNAVIKNPAPASVDGSERISHRYSHIETEINAKFAENPNVNPFAEWVSLGGEGKTKEETRAGTDAVETDDNSDEDHANDHLHPSSAAARAGRRPRAASASETQGPHLMVPPAHRPNQRVPKRPHASEDGSRPSKAPRIQQPQTTVDPRLPTVRPSRNLVSHVQGPSTRAPIRYVKCCKCPNQPPRLWNSPSSTTCDNCGEGMCVNCVYLAQDPQTGKTSQMYLPFSGKS